MVTGVTGDKMNLGVEHGGRRRRKKMRVAGRGAAANRFELAKKLLRKARDHSADCVVRDEQLRDEWGAGARRGAAATEPILDGGSLVGMAIHCEDRVLHDAKCYWA